MALFGRVLLIAFFSVIFVSGIIAPVELYRPGISHAQELPKKRGILSRLFGRQKKTKVAPPKAIRPKQKTRETATRREKPQALPKLKDANRVLVIGDELGGELAAGLKQFYFRTPSVEVISRIDKHIALRSVDYHRWVDASDFTFVGDRVRAVIVSIGTFDRGDITPNGRSLAFSTPEWERAYRRRLVDMVGQLQLIGVPVIWVLPPPVIDDDNTNSARTIGALHVHSLEKSGFQLVDVNAGFTGVSGEYRASGASLSGSRVQLRSSDGIGFTNQGRQKFAHYVKIEIEKILNQEDGQGLNFDLAAQKKYSTNRVLNLTRAPLLPNVPLAGKTGRVRAFYGDATARGFFVDGKALVPPTGRVDNFIWDSAHLSKPGQTNRVISRNFR